MHHFKNSFPATLILSAALTLSCCAPPSTTEPTPPVPEEALSFLENIATNILAPAHAHFVDKAAMLDTSLTALVAAPEDPAALIEAQEAWKQAMSAWQALAVLQIGPAGSSVKAIGGANLRDEIYSWPTGNACRIDQEIVENQFIASDYFSNNLINSYGLDALEYLLFNPNNENQCRSLTNINANGSWDNLTSSELSERRAHFGKTLTATILVQAQQLNSFWKPATGEFYHHFSAPDQDSFVYGNYTKAVNDLYRALFYVEKTVKDTKLGVPLGLVPPCDDGVLCPEEVESHWASYSREAIIANLESFQAVFMGSQDPTQEGIGFDDLLIEQGAQTVADTIEEGISDALVSLRSLNVSLKMALESDIETLREAHAALKKAMGQFKTEFADILELEVPQEGAGDND